RTSSCRSRSCRSRGWSWVALLPLPIGGAAPPRRRAALRGPRCGVPIHRTGRSGLSPKLSRVEKEELGGYRLIEELGAGGMGVVYLGVNGGNSPVVVKVLHPHNSSEDAGRKRLARETRTLRRIKHPRIAEVLVVE